MIILAVFAFLAGIITILSPCILPILPIILSGSFGSKRKPLGIVIGFILSFTFFTLFLSALVRVSGIPPDILRNISVIIILIFGISLILPQFQIFTEKLFSRLSGRFAVQGNHEGFHGGVFIGLSLGLIWTPCVGPIIASVITLAATNSVNLTAFIITFFYALGTAIPMFAIMLGGRTLLQKVPWLLPNTAKIQKIFGVVMILTAVAIFFNIDRKFQVFILDKFPSYGTNLTSIEDNSQVKEQLDSLFNSKSNNSDKNLEDYGAAPEIIPGGEWYNLPAGRQGSNPIKLADQKGKVVLVDFWTYSCINCIRTLPYLTRWHDKYKDNGLVILGVHSPEFEFEKNPQNVKKAIEDFGIEYPVVQDNNFATWQAYSNRYWPAKYLIDKDGKVRYVHFGEGNYDETEKAIQTLLKEAGSSVDEEISNSTYAPNSDITHETYLGSARMDYFYPNRKLSQGERNFTAQTNFPVNTFTLGGTWNIMPEYSESISKSVLIQNFKAQQVFLVMRSVDGKPKKVKIFLDNQTPESNAGKDVVNGIVTVEADRLYELINLPEVANKKLRLEFENGIEVFAFTFG